MTHFAPVEVSVTSSRAFPHREHYNSQSWMIQRHERHESPSSLEMDIAGKTALSDNRRIQPQLKPDHSGAAESPE